MDEEMDLKGGVIVIGSLLWDNSDRCKWRKSSLEDLASKIPVPLKIRYGRGIRVAMLHLHYDLFK